MLSLLLLASAACGLQYAPKTPPLTTDWTSKVGEHPWPEYPRPSLVRPRWASLNGVWSYRNATEASLAEALPTGELDQGVLVPSCLESGLSGVMAAPGTAKYSWFQRTFTVPTDWDDDTLLHFDAVDYEATIFINGKQVHFHRGGYDRFSINITPELNDGENELLVHVYDPTTDGAIIPSGKQVSSPRHIFYTPCSGIWQSVWLEPVPKVHITKVDVSGDMRGDVSMKIVTNGRPDRVAITVNDGRHQLFSGTFKTNREIHFNVPQVENWAPDTPRLYSIEMTTGDDTISTYTGFRSITKGKVQGVTRPLLNGEFLYAFGTLDQGYWPDGIYTPPTYEAMVSDLELLKDLGFNMVRKHIKVENDLFYHACDKLGLLVIQDMPSMPQWSVPNHDQQEEFKRQLLHMVETHKSFPSIWTWLIYNEGWGQLDSAQLELEPLVRELDPTRLIDAVSGWSTFGHAVGDFSDNHHYTDPQCGTPWHSTSAAYDPELIGFQGEFGGVGHNVSIEHLWNEATSIAAIPETFELDEDLDVWNLRTHHLLGVLRYQTERFACSGGIYTQTSDVEGEVNGLITYDRRLLRADRKQWREDIQALYHAAHSRGARTYPSKVESAPPGQIVFF